MMLNGKQNDDTPLWLIYIAKFTFYTTTGFTIYCSKFFFMIHLFVFAYSNISYSPCFCLDVLGWFYIMNKNLCILILSFRTSHYFKRENILTMRIRLVYLLECI